MKKILFLLLLLQQTGLCFSQQIQPDNLQFNRLSIKNGLPEDVITAFLQDREGYIWIGTQGGLVRYDGYTTRVFQFGLDDLNLASVSYLFEDRSGGLWVGTTSNGLYQYNPEQDDFVHYGHNPKDSNSIPEGQIISIRDDAAGNIWAISQDPYKKCSLNHLDPKKKKLSRFGISEKGDHLINAYELTDVFENASGRIWLGSSNGFYEYMNAGDHFVPHFAASEYSKQKGCNQLTADPSDPGTIWMTVKNTEHGTGEGIWRYNSKNNTIKPYRHIPGDSTSLGNDLAVTINKDSKGRLWFGTYNGLSFLDVQSNSFINYMVTDKNVGSWEAAMFIFAEDRDGNIWSGNQNRLFVTNTKTRTIAQYKPNEKNPGDLPANGYSNVFNDRSGTLWFGTVFRGLNWLNYKRAAFTVYKNNPGLLHYFPGGGNTSFAEDKDGTFWIWSSGGLYHWNSFSDSFDHIKQMNSYGEKLPWYFSSIIVDRTGQVWCSSFGRGIYQYDPKSKTVKNFRYKKDDSSSLSSDNITVLCEDHRGTIWIGTFGGGICSYDPQTNTFRRYRSIENHINTPNNGALDDHLVFCIHEDKQGTLWVGTNLGGLNRFNRESGTFTSFQNQTPGFMTISSIFEDNEGNLWSGTHEGGLFLFDRKTQTSKKFTEKDGLLYNGTLGLNADNKNNLWVISQRGISVLNNQTHKFSHLDMTSGLPEEPENNLGFFKARDGRFFLPCDNGFIVFDPAQLTPDTIPPIIHIESMEIPAARIIGHGAADSIIYIHTKDKIELRYNQNRITFNYIGLQYQNSALNQYAYKLDGNDKDWIEAGTLRKVTYTNLSPRTYTFHVRAANSDGIWNPEEQSFMIVIAPPFWMTWWAYILYALFAGATIWAFVNYRARSLIMENVVLEDKIALRTSQLKQSLEDLKSTQTQLIQSEKMASLGELTAGIAHEIQNPLNFVNNFSDVNTELLTEMKEEMGKGNLKDAEDIANNIIENEEKINHHGKRADAIVKGMLLHSRSAAGTKEPTDINALAEEYLKLAYHGLRAKDKSFNAATETHLDENIGTIRVVPQEIGRVLLNLINNSFYAVAEKKKQHPNGYEPKVTVTTKKAGDKVELMVADNGNGIPQKIADKIFQPFFTTKPAGQGTGLGLSLSYDTVKAHGGEIKLETQAGEGTMFTVVLPKNG